MGVPFSSAHSAVLSCSHSASLSSFSSSPSPLSSAMQHRTMSGDVGGGQGSGSQLLAGGRNAGHPFLAGPVRRAGPVAFGPVPVGQTAAHLLGRRAPPAGIREPRPGPHVHAVLRLTFLGGLLLAFGFPLVVCHAAL